MSIQQHKTKRQYRFLVWYTDEFGNRKRKGSGWYPTKKEALLAERQFLAESKKPVLTFESVFLDWLKSKKEGSPKSHKDRHDGIIQHFSVLLPMDIHRITEKVIHDAMTDEFLELSTSRKNRLLGYLSAILKHAKKYYGLETVPEIERFRKTEKEQMKTVEILTPEQFSRFLSCVENELYADLFLFLFWTGARCNEALSLTFNDWTGKTVKIWRQFDHQTGIWRPLKTRNSKREIYISRELQDMISKRKRAYQQTDPNFTDDFFIFGGANHMAHSHIKRIKDAGIMQAGLPYVKVHSFRHSHASYLLSHGVPVFKVSRRLGHASTAITTDIYGHLIKSEDDEIESLLG